MSLPDSRSAEAASPPRPRVLPDDEVLRIEDDAEALEVAETLAQVFVRLCAADPALGQIPQTHYALLTVLRELGTPLQQRRFHAEVLAGRRLGNAGPERRSPRNDTILRSAPRIEEGADGLRLDGQRFYSTGALFAHRIPTRAIDAQGRQVQAWVPFDAPGVRVVDDWNSIGQRTTASGSVFFYDVRVAADDIPPVWQLAERPGITGPTSQLLQAAIDQGIAEAAFADTLAFVRERARPWIDSGLERATDDPYLIADIGRLQIGLHAAHEVLLEAARTLDEIGPGADRRAGESARFGGRGRGEGVDDARRALGQREAVRACRCVGHASAARARSPLAQRAHAHAARSGALEDAPDRQLPAQWRAAGTPCLELRSP